MNKNFYLVIATIFVFSFFVSNSAYAVSSTNDFAVLANQAVTVTDGTVNGDIGTFQNPSTGSVTLTDSIVNGTVHIGDGAAKSAYNAFVAEYEALAVQAGECTAENTLTGTLANVSLPPGTYCFDAAATLTGTLTLTGNGEWTFLVLGALTGTNFTVVMAEGGDPCNVTWWVEAGATMTDSNFIGTILAGAGITLTRGTFEGNAYAGASGVGDVTITVTEVTGCEGSSKGNQGVGSKCNQGVGNGPEITCDPGNSNQGDETRSNDELAGSIPSNPGRKGGNGK